MNLHENIPEVEKEINSLLKTENEQIIENEIIENNPLPLVENDNTMSFPVVSSLISFKKGDIHFTPTTATNVTPSLNNNHIFNRLYCFCYVGSLLETCWKDVGRLLELADQSSMKQPSISAQFCNPKGLVVPGSYAFQQGSNIKISCQHEGVAGIRKFEY